MFNDLKNDMNCMTDWFRANKLSLNLANSNYVLFWPKKKRVDIMFKKINLRGEEIEASQSAKFLGFTVDE